MSKVNVTITVSRTDAEAAYRFLRESVGQVHVLTAEMDDLTKAEYRRGPACLDRVAIELGHAVGEVDLKPMGDYEGYR